MASMGCIVALPDKALFQGEITYANIPGTDGYFGVLPGARADGVAEPRGRPGDADHRR